MQYEITFMDLLTICLKRKIAIVGFTVIFVCIALFYVWLIPDIYRAECRIVLPFQESGTTSILSQLGGIANLNLGSMPPAKGKLLIGILSSRAVTDKIIDKFDLMTLYNEQYRLNMFNRITTRMLDVVNTGDGIITIAILDKDPVLAAEIANAFIEELKNVMQNLAIGEAAQRRLFFEQQMLQARKTLDEAEDALSEYQEKSGLVAMEQQVATIVSSSANLRAQVAAKEVELSSLKTFASSNNPNLRRAESELVALRTALEKLEQEQKSSDENMPMTSLREAPQLGLEYQRKIRDIRYASAIYDLMLKQFESAKIDESNESMVVQILDLAVPPDYKYKPRRTLIVTIATLFGFCCGISWVLFANYIGMMKRDTVA